MPQPPIDTALTWRKSSHSAQGADCVEVAELLGSCAVRDSKDPDGPRLTLTPRAWTRVLTGVKTGAHDLP